jgi:iron complex transport system substrate-binding protein
MRNVLALLLLMAVVAAGCGGDDEAVEPNAIVDEAFPVTVVHGLGELTLDAAPVRIVSLSPTATEMLFAIGAGDQVIAVDNQSNYPAEAPMTDLAAFTPNVEAIIGFEPDLVISQGLPEDIEAGLGAAGIATMSLFAAASFDDVYSQIETLGAATGHLGDAAELVGTMQADLAAILDEVVERETPVTFFHELDPTPYSVTSATFIGQVYALAGLENIADDGDPEGFGYPLLSVEYILDKDPDLIFLADTKCCGESAESIAARAGWDELNAIQNGNVIALDDDIASRWGPRVVDLARTVVDATTAIELAPAA